MQGSYYRNNLAKNDSGFPESKKLITVTWGERKKMGKEEQIGSEKIKCSKLLRKLSTGSSYTKTGNDEKRPTMDSSERFWKQLWSIPGDCNLEEPWVDEYRTEIHEKLSTPLLYIITQ